MHAKQTRWFKDVYDVACICMSYKIVGSMHHVRRSPFVSIASPSTIPFQPGTNGNIYKTRNIEHIVAAGEMCDRQFAVCSAVTIAREKDIINRVHINTQIVVSQRLHCLDIPAHTSNVQLFFL